MTTEEISESTTRQPWATGLGVLILSLAFLLGTSCLVSIFKAGSGKCDQFWGIEKIPGVTGDWFCDIKKS